MTHNHIHTLIDRFLAGTATPEEQEEMQAYFVHHGLQEEKMEKGNEFHPDKEQSARMYAQLVQQLQPGRGSNVYPMNKRLWLRIAAVLIPIAMMVAAMYLFLRPSPSLDVPAMAEYSNYGNSIRYLRLQDGSEIWLNKNAVIQLDTSDFSGNRNISLRGEAYFDVATDPAHPFSVNTGSLKTVVLGTSFSVNSDSVHTRITLFTGKVSLQAAGIPSQLLDPGQAGVYDPRTGKLELSAASPYAIAWKTREIDCKNEKLESIIQFLQQYYDTGIKISHRITGKQFSGTLSLQGNLSSVLNRLLFVHQLQHKKNTDGSIVIY
jgi:ferric-dicitrate binding protein FerR (iron transport regulator)